MGEVRRSTTCPVCGQRLLIVFDSRHPLRDAPVNIECPRAREAGACEGRIETYVPARYQVVLAEP